MEGWVGNTFVCVVLSYFGTTDYVAVPYFYFVFYYKYSVHCCIVCDKEV